MISTRETFDLAVECYHCGTVQCFTVSQDDYWKWAHGALVQDAFPYLTPGQREMIISQTCNDCWDSMFGDM